MKGKAQREMEKKGVGDSLTAGNELLLMFLV